MAQLHDRSPAAVTVEERIGWIPLWEMALDCGERCVRKIQWPVASEASITTINITSITTVTSITTITTTSVMIYHRGMSLSEQHTC